MTDPSWWDRIEGLGRTRAKILERSLGIRSLEALHASAVDEIVEAIEEAGSQAKPQEVKAWLQAARAHLKEETRRDWDALVRSVRLSQKMAGSMRTFEAGATPTVPLSSGESFVIELDLTKTGEVDPELELSPVASHKKSLVLYRPDRTSGAHRWLVPQAERGLYRLSVRAEDGSVVRGPIVQTV